MFSNQFYVDIILGLVIYVEITLENYLKKFMEIYKSKQTNREPDLSDYKEYKLKEDNKGNLPIKSTRTERY